jgi:hypothetical protein
MDQGIHGTHGASQGNFWTALVRVVEECREILWKSSTCWALPELVGEGVLLTEDGCVGRVGL